MTHDYTGELIEGFNCPRCKHESIVYNGNYFCARSAFCEWALGDGKAVWNRYGYKLYIQLMKQREKPIGPGLTPEGKIP